MATEEMATEAELETYGAIPRWSPGRPKLRARRLLLQWVTSALALYVAAALVPGVKIEGLLGALIAAALIAVLNALVPPLVAALRLPYMLAVGFLLVLLLDAWMVEVAARLSDHTFSVSGFFAALLVSLVAAAVTVVLEVLLGTNDDDVYSLRVTQRIARRSRRPGRRPTCPGSSTWRSTASPGRCCSAPSATGMRPRWRAGSRAARIASPSGRRTSRRRPAPPRRACCSAPTTTSPPSAGSRRSRGAS